jgi:hypothetical protein
MGARVIELDCFAKNNKGTTLDDMTPIVAHGLERKSGDYFTTSYINFEECINVILQFGFLTSDPLIICLELNTNKLNLVQKKMREIIIQKLGDKLLNQSFKISQGPNRKIFTYEPIKNLLNKVIFLSGEGYTDELTDIIDGTFNESQYFNNTNNTDNNLNEPNKLGVIQRIYPTSNLSGHLSLNYDPTKFWKNKYQLVALNFQAIDHNFIKNIAMFKFNSFVHFSEFN